MSTVATERAIEQVEQNANSSWMDMAYEILEEVAGKNSEITADMVWDAIRKHPDMPYQHEPSALGPVFRQAQRNRIIQVKKGITAESTRPGAHRKPMRVWQSLLCPIVKTSNIPLLEAELERYEQTIKEFQRLQVLVKGRLKVLRKDAEEPIRRQGVLFER